MNANKGKTLQVTLTGRSWIEAGSLAEASRMCQEYIEKRMIGASQFRGGEIRENGRPIAWVSYNGKVWAVSPRDWKPGDEPLID